MPTFSEIEITFIVDYEVGYTAQISNSLDGVTPVSQLWRWVTTRSAGYEVTTGTATGTPGERAAINYKAAFDLDNATNYETTIASNVVTIKAERSNETFLGFKGVDGTNILFEGVDFDVTFNNYLAPIDNSNIEFALTKSPHYVNIPFLFTTTTAANVNVFIWNGDLDSPPSTATYALTIPRPTVNFAEFNIDISKLIDEKINPTPVITLSSTTQVIDSTADSVKWVTYTASYVDAVETLADITGTFVAVDGYGYYNEGVNPTKPTDNILTSASIRKVSRAGFILFPFVNNASITTIDIDTENNQIDATETITGADASTKMVQYVSVDVSQASTDNYVTITTQPDGDIITYEIVDECRYEPIQVVFKNKYGVYDCLTLFKKSGTSSNVKNEEFINNYISGGTYDTTKHQYQKLNVTAKKSIKVNSGYVNEIENLLYEQLLYSDTVYFYESALLDPVNVKTSSLEYKTRVNDKLVNYNIEFEYAYNIIQNI